MNEVSRESEIKNYLSKKSYKYKDSYDNINVHSCPSCEQSKPAKGLSENLWKLYILKSSGAFNCQRCGWKGSWFEFLQYHGDAALRGVNSNPAFQSKRKYNRPDPKRIAAYQEMVLASVEGELESPVVEYAKKRKIRLDTLKSFSIGENVLPYEKDKPSEPSVAFPFIRDGEHLSFKHRSIIDKGHMRIEPAGAELFVFGSQLVKDTSEIILCEGEWDCMAIWQETGRNVVSLPNGNRSCPEQIVKYLQGFDKIYLGLDSDPAGNEGVERIVLKMKKELHKLWRVNWNLSKGVKDANDALLANYRLNDIIEYSSKIRHEKISTVNDYKQEILDEDNNPLQADGLPFTGFDKLTKLLGGLRPGELTIVSGATGAGKSTILSQLSIGFMQQGQPTLWGAFENGNKEQIKKMVKQFAQIDFKEHPEGKDYWIDKLAELPLWLLDFTDNADMELVFEAMEYAVKAYDVQHVILDNLQFVIGTQFRGDERYDGQDKVVERCRQFARDFKIHVTLVAHPKKYDEDKEITAMQISGHAKTVQEAYNIIILQRLNNKNYLTIEKCRKTGGREDNGSKGKVNLKFDRATECFSEAPESDPLAPDNKPKAKNRNYKNNSYISAEM